MADVTAMLTVPFAIIMYAIGETIEAYYGAPTIDGKTANNITAVRISDIAIAFWSW